MSDIKENLEEVKAEAKTMLETLAAIRGKQYSETVRVLLLCRQLAEIINAMAMEMKSTNPGMAAACAEASMHSLMQIATCQRIVGAVSDDDWAAMATDTGSLIKSINGLMRRAVEAGMSGEQFGGHA
jgi:hypothetical protein